MVQTIAVYQGEDFSQQLTLWSDPARSVPLIFTNPVMDLRSPEGALLATFDTTGTHPGSAAVPADGVLQLAMAYADTASLPPGTYPVDVFADVGSSRKAIIKRGQVAIKVLPRITQDTGP